MVKYGYRRCPRGLCAWQFHGRHCENIVNRPSMALQTKRLRTIMQNNLKLKYLMRYEKRAAEQKIKIKMKEREAQFQKHLYSGGKYPLPPPPDARAYESLIDHEEAKEDSQILQKD